MAKGLGALLPEDRDRQSGGAVFAVTKDDQPMYTIFYMIPCVNCGEVMVLDHKPVDQIELICCPND
jgi:hypothetical protein